VLGLIVLFLIVGMLALYKGADLVVVFCFFEKKGREMNSLIEDLVDVELDSGSKILKVVEESELFGVGGGEMQSEKLALVERFKKLIINFLFDQSAFSPEEGS